jgi:hypothetical protein
MLEQRTFTRRRWSAAPPGQSGRSDGHFTTNETFPASILKPQSNNSDAVNLPFFPSGTLHVCKQERPHLYGSETIATCSPAASRIWTFGHSGML